MTHAVTRRPKEGNPKKPNTWSTFKEPILQDNFITNVKKKKKKRAYEMVHKITSS